MIAKRASAAVVIAKRASAAVVRPWLVAGLLGLVGCGDIGGFSGTRSLDTCGDSYPVCNTSAGCVLDDSHYVQGTLPGQRTVIYRSPSSVVLRVRLLLTIEQAPGNLTQIAFHDVGCGNQQVFSVPGSNLFQLAGDAQQIVADKPVQGAGDHLIQLTSDAMAQYELLVELAQ